MNKGERIIDEIHNLKNQQIDTIPFNIYFKKDRNPKKLMCSRHIPFSIIISIFSMFMFIVHSGKLFIFLHQNWEKCRNSTFKKFKRIIVTHRIQLWDFFQFFFILKGLSIDYLSFCWVNVASMPNVEYKMW